MDVINFLYRILLEEFVVMHRENISVNFIYIFYTSTIDIIYLDVPSVYFILHSTVTYIEGLNGL